MQPRSLSFGERIGEWLARPSLEYGLLALCLGAFHLVLVQGPETPVGRTLMLAHLGLFLLWQPVVRGAYRLGARNALIMVAVLAGIATFLSWGLVSVWVIVLASVVSGAAFSVVDRRGRWPYRLALADLIVSLLMLILPQLVPVAGHITDTFGWFLSWGLPCLIVGVAFGRPAAPHAHARGIDFVSAMLVFLVLTIMVLGALAAMWLMKLPYLVAIIFALFATAGALAIMAWAWDPRMGGPQLGAQFMRRLLSAGMSFEEWLHEVAALSEANEAPADFLQQACDRLVRLPGVLGGRWRVPEGSGQFGEAGKLEWVKHGEPLELTLFLSGRPTAAMDWHLDLTVRLLAQFYLEKRHAQALEALSYVRAVHETGARLTHDVKNLLQSLNTLCFTAAQPDTDPDTLQALVGRQLPEITRRLGSTLEKLRVPGAADPTVASLARWWPQAQERYAGLAVEFTGTAGEVPMPEALFDTALDHLLQNALCKQALDAGVKIRAVIGVERGQAWLSVEDTGPAIDPRIRGRLFHQPVPSETGLGMGLYQLQQMAAASGYRVDLALNEPGGVHFRLAYADSADA